MKNRDSKKDKRVEKSTEIAGKMPYHRNDKLQKERWHQIPEKYPRTSPPLADDAGRSLGEHFGK